MEYATPSCPFLRLKTNPQTSAAYPTADNICSRSRRQASPSSGYQLTFCLKANYSNCPVYTGRSRNELPVGFRGPSARTSGRLPNWIPWMIFPMIGVVIVALFGFRAMYLAHPGEAAPQFPALPFLETSTASRSAIPGSTDTAPALVFNTRTPTGTLGLTTTATHAQTPTRTPTLYRYRTPTNTPNPSLASQTITFGALADKTYGDAVFWVSATSSSGLIVTFIASGGCTSSGITGNIITITGAVPCTVIASQDGNYKYNPASPVSQSFKINKANASCTVTPYTLPGAIFDGFQHDATGFCTGVGGVPLISSDLNRTGTYHTNAGIYNNDPWTFIDSTGNYNNTSGIVNDSIGRANAICSVTGYTFTYNGTSHTVSIASCTGVGGVNLTSDLDLTGTTHTNANTYSDTWTFTDSSGNYNNISNPVTDKINPATASCSISGYTFTYDNFSHTATGTCTGVGGVNLTSDLDLTGTTHTNANTYSDTWTFTDSSGNYNNIINPVTDKINPATASCTAATGYAVTYDSNPHTATAGTCTGIGGVDLSIGIDMSGTTHTDANTYSDSWNLVDTNYSGSGSVADSITKRDQTIIFTNPGSQTYGPDFNIIATADSGLTVSISTSGKCTNSGKTITMTGVGSCTVTASQGGDFNNNSASDVTQSFSISEADAICHITPYKVAYDSGNPFTATGYCTGAKGEDLTSGLNLAGTTHTDVGDYTTDSWSYHDINGNYNDASGTIEDIITP